MPNIKDAVTAFQANNLREAERICIDLLRSNPGEPRALVLLGMTYANSGRIEQGIEALRTASRRNRNVLPIEANLAMLLARAGRNEEAIGAYRSALALAPTNSELKAGYARVLSETGFRLQSQGLFGEARSLLEESLEVEPRQGMTYAGIALGQRLGESDKPLIDLMYGVLDQSILSGTDLAYLHFALGKAREDLGAYEESMSHFDHANQIAYEAWPSTRDFRKELYRASLTRMAGLFTTDRLKVSGSAGCEGPQPIFVLGVMRSGTTLAEQILSSHPDVAGAGELDFWMRSGAEAIRSSAGNITSSLIDKLRDDYLGVIRNQANGAQWVTDKMPQNYQWIGLIHLAFPSAPIIHLNRAALDTAVSIWTTPYERPPDFVHNKANIIEMMDVHREIMEHWRSVLPTGRILDIGYEDLVSTPGPVIRNMIEACGLVWDDKCLTPEKNKRAVHTASYWQARQPVYTSSVSRWRRFEPWLGEFRALLPKEER